MKNTFLVITSIANDQHPVLKEFATQSSIRGIPFILVGDTKSPDSFNLDGCNYYSIEKQQELNFELASILPTKHYARKNLGYLIAISKGAEVIIETDDDNIPFNSFWEKRSKIIDAKLYENHDWINVYKFFSDFNIWPRGFALEFLQMEKQNISRDARIMCPIQQGLADENPDVDAIYRLTLPLPITFKKADNVALGTNTICPFNSQNTTWFQEAFALLYLPSYCSFRMTDIWRSFVAQRVAWSCSWPILFHQSTVWQERNEHDLMHDFKDEIVGYNFNKQIMEEFKSLNLRSGAEHIPINMKICYDKLIEMGLVDCKERVLLDAWLNDIRDLSA